MFTRKRLSEISFHGVGMAMIALGAIILALGLAFWGLNIFADYGFVSPSTKVIGGALIIGLGYLILELELLRKQ